MTSSRLSDSIKGPLQKAATYSYLSYFSSYGWFLKNYSRSAELEKTELVFYSSRGCLYTMKDYSPISQRGRGLIQSLVPLNLLAGRELSRSWLHQQRQVGTGPSCYASVDAVVAQRERGDAERTLGWKEMEVY